jgi:hypothetical protein
VTQVQLLKWIVVFDSGTMLSLTGTLASLCLVGNVLAQTSTYFSPGVPTDAPVPGEIPSRLSLEVYGKLIENR